MTEPPTHYQGRRLPRPDDEVEDQGLAFDLGTLLTRRRAFRVFGMGAVAAGVAACSSDPAATSSAVPSSAATASSGDSTSASNPAASSSHPAATSTRPASAGNLVEIPNETAGPYPGDGSNGPDVLDASGVVRQDIRASFGTSTTVADGVPMTLTLTILDIASGGGPMVGAAVYVWHCDQAGRYSMYSSGVENENYLRGVQITDSDGKVNYTSIFPACYSGRWPHIHFEVYPGQASITDAANAIAISQVALPKATCDVVYQQPGYEQSVTNLARLTLATDNVFGDDGGVHQLGVVSGDVTAGYAVTLTAPVDTGTALAAGNPHGGGPGGSPPQGGPGGPPPDAPTTNG